MNHDFGTALSNLKMGGRVTRKAWQSFGNYWIVLDRVNYDPPMIVNEQGDLVDLSLSLLAEDWIINAWVPDADYVEEAPIKVNLLGLPRFGVSDDGAMPT